MSGMFGAEKISKKHYLKSWIALCLAVMMATSLTGCGPSGSLEGESTVYEESEESGRDNTAMGRYVESTTEVEAGAIMDLVRLDDGRLVILEDGAAGRMISEDGGVTWREDMLPGWYDLVSEGNFMVDMKASSDGSAAILCKNYEGDYTNEPESKIYLISEAGETQWARLPLAEGEKLKSLCFSEDGSRLFTASKEGKIYEIDRDTGEGKLLMTVDIGPEVFCVWEKYMAVKSEADGVFLYDMDTMDRIEDEVLTEFVSQNCPVNKNLLLSTYTIFPAEEGGLYLVCEKGMYRHVIGGAVMEQVINGGLCSLSDPTEHIAKMIRTQEEGFLAVCSEGKFSAFTYDPNISTTPSQKITVYSLTESTILRQAIIRYQGANPDIYVEYKIGMDGESGGTREDAVKKLNTEIMAGKGPDFLILDGLPADSYLEKGVLADIGPYLEELEKEEKLLPNIKESFTKDGKICMIPAAVTLPMYMTDERNMTSVSDLSALADMFEQTRNAHPGEEIMEAYSESMLLDALMPVSAPLWFEEAGQLNTEELSDYLAQTKRIYDACMDGLPEDVLEEYLARVEEEYWVVSSDEAGAYNDLQGGAIQIVAGNVQISMGPLLNAYNYAFLQSVKKNEGGEGSQEALIPGSVKDAFSPVALMGISAVSAKADLAGGLLQSILSSETQSMLYPAGFPVNEAGLSEYLESLGGRLSEEMRVPGEIFGGYGFSGEDGVISLKMYVPTEEENSKLHDILTSVRTPYLSDVVVEDAVREAGRQYLRGRCSLEEAVEFIQKKLVIYMAE